MKLRVGKRTKEVKGLAVSHQTVLVTTWSIDGWQGPAPVPGILLVVPGKDGRDVLRVRVKKAWKRGETLFVESWKHLGEGWA